MQKIVAKFLKRVRTCEGMNESLSLECFSTFLRGLRERQYVIGTTQHQKQGHRVPAELDSLDGTAAARRGHRNARNGA